jgi:hypothetical protein
MKHLRDEAPHWRGGYVGGIWQSVRLVASHPVFTRDVFVEPDIARSRTRVLPVNRDVRPHPVFDGLPAGGFTGPVYQNIVPQFTLLGLPGAPLAGCVSWDHNKDYTGPTEVWHGTNLAVLPHGCGRMVLSTFNFIEHLGTDPAADKLLLNLCRWSSAQTNPGMEEQP